MESTDDNLGPQIVDAIEEFRSTVVELLTHVRAGSPEVSSQVLDAVEASLTVLGRLLPAVRQRLTAASTRQQRELELLGLLNLALERHARLIACVESKQFPGDQELELIRRAHRQAQATVDYCLTEAKFESSVKLS